MTGQYKLWHIPQVPGKPFEVESNDLPYLAKLQDKLAEYDLFQYENRIKPDYSNISGICRRDEDGEWTDVDETFELPELLEQAERLARNPQVVENVRKAMAGSREHDVEWVPEPGENLPLDPDGYDPFGNFVGGQGV